MDIRLKERIIVLFKHGMTVDQLAQKYPEVTRGTLIAIKANVTRGTYR
jgi:uncharacterized protein (DUF433 family)